MVGLNEMYIMSCDLFMYDKQCLRKSVYFGLKFMHGTHINPSDILFTVGPNQISLKFKY